MPTARPWKYITSCGVGVVNGVGGRSRAIDKYVDIYIYIYIYIWLLDILDVYVRKCKLSA